MPKRSGRKMRSSKIGTSYLNGQDKHEMQQDKKINRLDKKIKQLNNEAEVKYHDVNVSVAPVQTIGDLVLLNGIGQSASQVSGRIGAKIKATSIQLRLRLQAPSGADADMDNIRVIIFWDRDAKGAAPTVSGNPLATAYAVLSDQAGGTYEWLYPYMMETRNRFKILFDKTYDFNPQMATLTTPATGAVDEILPMIKTVNKYIKLNRTVQYGDSGAGIADIDNNSLYILYISASNGATVLGTTRFCYKDF